MINLFETSKQIKNIKNYNFRGMQDYLNDKNLANSRMKFKIAAKMVENVPGNFQTALSIMKLG